MKVSHGKPAAPQKSSRFPNPLPKAVAIVAVAIVVIAGAGVLIVTPPPPPPAAPVTGRQLPYQIRIVLDTSASMNGYFSGKTEFKDLLAKIVAGIPRLLSTEEGSSISYHFTQDAGEDLEAYEGTPQELIEDVLNSRVSTGGSSMLGDIVAQLVKEPSADRVDVFITDGIPSYPNAQVKQSPEINRDNLEGLASQLQTILQNANWTENELVPAVAVLQYASRFKGTYYTYRNDRLPCCESKRPFYVWIVGASALVKGLAAGITETPELTPSHSVLIGAADIKAAPRVLQYSMRTGTWARDAVDLLRVNGLVAKSEQVTVALNIADMPAETLESAHALKHLTATSDFARVVPVSLVARGQATLDSHDADVLTGATHFLTLKVDALNVDAALVRVTLRNVLPEWIQGMSTDDDRAMAVLDPTPTFGLLPLIGGMWRALQQSPSVFEFQLALER